MKCATCKANNIDPRKAFVVAYLCDNNHIQCKGCEKELGRCGVCKLNTCLLEMHVPAMEKVERNSQNPNNGMDTKLTVAAMIPAKAHSSPELTLTADIASKAAVNDKTSSDDILKLLATPPSNVDFHQSQSNILPEAKLFPIIEEIISNQTKLPAIIAEDSEMPFKEVLNRTPIAGHESYEKQSEDEANEIHQQNSSSNQLESNSHSSGLIFKVSAHSNNPSPERPHQQQSNNDTKAELAYKASATVCESAIAKAGALDSKCILKQHKSNRTKDVSFGPKVHHMCCEQTVALIYPKHNLNLQYIDTNCEEESKKFLQVATNVEVARNEDNIGNGIENSINIENAKSGGTARYWSYYKYEDSMEDQEKSKDVSNVENVENVNNAENAEAIPTKNTINNDGNEVKEENEENAKFDDEILEYIDLSALDSQNTMRTSDIIRRYLESYDTSSYPDSSPNSSEFAIADSQNETFEIITSATSDSSREVPSEANINDSKVDRKVTIAHARFVMPPMPKMTYPMKFRKSMPSESECCMNKLLGSFREKITYPTKLKKLKPPVSDCCVNKLLQSFQEQSRLGRISDSPFQQIRGDHIYKLPIGSPWKQPSKTELTKTHSLENGGDYGKPVMPVSSTAAIILDQHYEDFSIYLTNAFRAFFSPIRESISLHKQLYCSNVHYNGEASLLVQFEPIEITDRKVVECIKTRARNMILYPLKVELLNIIRTPIRCPDSACSCMIFISDFNKHLAIQHADVPLETICSQQWKHIYLDFRIPFRGKTKCHMVLFLKHKIEGLGSSQFKDYLPIMLLSSRISCAEMANLTAAPRNMIRKYSKQDYLMLWAATIPSDGLCITATMVIYKFLNNKPIMHIVRSGKVYSIRESQSTLDIWENAPYMLLSPKQLSTLSNNGLEWMEMQLFIH